MYAVIETGGKQYRVSQGEVLRVEKIPGSRGDTVVFDKILLVGDEHIRTGDPYVKDYVVKATVLRQGKDRKIRVFKYKAKSNYRRRYGHRQPFTEIKIASIEPA